MEQVPKKDITIAYDISLLFKGIQALLEVVAGVLLSVISTNKITTFILSLSHGEFIDTSRDTISNFLIHSAYSLSATGTFFIAFYLLSHGIIKLVIIIALYLKKPWAYPASLIGFGALILYQLYRLVITHSISLLIFTLMDIIILWLIWREHTNEKKDGEL